TNNKYTQKTKKAKEIYYLLKPIDIDKLVEAIKKAAKHQVLNNALNRNTSLQNLENDLKEQKGINRLTLPSGQGYRLVDIDDIIHIEADSNYSIFHLKGEEKITVSKVLKEYEEILPEDKFVRIHKSSIVNLKYVKEYNNKNGLVLLL